MEELADGDKRIVRRYGSVAVYGAVAEGDDDAGFVEYGFAGGLFEAGVVDVGGEVVLVGDLQRGVIFVRPANGELERPSGIEAGCSGVGVDGRLGLPARVVFGGPFALEKGELAHGSELASK